MTRLTQMLKPLLVDVNENVFSSMKGIDDLTQPVFVSFELYKSLSITIDRMCRVLRGLLSRET